MLDRELAGRCTAIDRGRCPGQAVVWWVVSASAFGDPELYARGGCARHAGDVGTVVAALGLLDGPLSEGEVLAWEVRRS